MRSSNAVRKTFPATEIRRRGLSVIDNALKRGPVHVLKDNKPTYVIMAEEQYRELSEQYQRSYVNRVRQSLKDLNEGHTRKTTAQSLIDELGSEHMTRHTGSIPRSEHLQAVVQETISERLFAIRRTRTPQSRHVSK